MVEVRKLVPGDEARMEAFLVQHAASSMFLRANSRGGGLLDGGERLHGTYVGACEDGAVVAVAAHYWNGIIAVQAPVELARVVCEAARLSGRAVKGVTGPLDHVSAARAALGLAGAAALVDSAEILYRLELAALRVPEPLASGRLTCRQPRADELAVCAAWRAAYEVETLGAAAGVELDERTRRDVAGAHARGVLWLVLEGDRPLAQAAFNARLPDLVQVGGVYTPPELRGRGHARAVVAGQLLAARADGATTGILFTPRENLAAQRAYTALGFHPIGDFGIVLFSHE